MSITNYTELQTAVASWLSRADLTSLIPDFIALAEAKFNRTLRTRNREAITSLTPASGVAALPSDFLQFRRIYIDSDTPQELEYLTPEVFYEEIPYPHEMTGYRLADSSLSRDRIYIYRTSPRPIR